MKEEETRVSEDLIRETDNFWDDPQKIMNLIDLIFLMDEDKEKVCS